MLKSRIEEFVSDVCAGKTNSTPAAYRSKLRRIERWAEENHLSLRQLTRLHIECFKRALLDQDMKRIGSKIVKGHLSPFTIFTVLRTLKQFLRWCHAHRLTHGDLSGFKVPPHPHPDPKAVEPGNVLALFHAAARMGQYWEQARNLAMLYLLRDTGGRIGAIVNADLDNLDLRKGKLYVHEKGGKPATLYFNSPASQALALWLKVRTVIEPKDNRLFLSYRGRGLTLGGFYSILNRLIDAAGIRGCGRVNPHAFRHAWARDALDSGEDISKVSETLHHSTTKVTTDWYARWSDLELQSAHAKYSPGRDLPVIKPKG